MVAIGAFSCAPYKLSREEFSYFKELYHPDCASQSKFIKGGQGRLIQHLEILKWLSFGVQEWLHKKALEGDEESLYKLEYGYDLYNEVLIKAKEEKVL